MYKPKKVILKNAVKWEVSFHINGRGSRRIRRRFDKKIDAEAFIKSFFAKENHQTSSTDFLDTINNSSEVRFFYDEYFYWLEVRGDELSASYKTRVEGIFKKINKMYPDLKVSSISNSFLSAFRKTLIHENYSSATVNRYVSVITSVLNHSYRCNRIDANPWVNFGLLYEHKEEISFWEREDVSQFLAYTHNKYIGGPKWWVHLSYVLALNTGLRAGELWGLKVKDINFNRGLITVERQLLHRERELSNTKGKNIRRVPCNDALKKMLSSHILENQLDRNAFVFSNEKGNPINHYNFRGRHFLVDIKKSKVKKIRFHDLRHTALTMMVQSNINLKVVQSIAGHADIKTTMKYVHLLSNSVEEVANSFELL